MIGSGWDLEFLTPFSYPDEKPANREFFSQIAFNKYGLGDVIVSVVVEIVWRLLRYLLQIAVT